VIDVPILLYRAVDVGVLVPVEVLTELFGNYCDTTNYICSLKDSGAKDNC
jgi:hypothetical protein